MAQDEARRGPHHRGAAPGGLESLNGTDMTLTYADDGQSLQRALIVGEAVLVLAGENGKPGREIAAKEAQAGRVYTCGSQSIGGYPFRIEVSCSETAADFRKPGSETALKMGPALVAAQIYDPQLVIGEFKGPLIVSSPHNPSSLEVNWTLAQTSVRGRPGASPERVSVVLNAARFEQVTGSAR